VHPLEIEGLVEANFPHARAVAIPKVQGEETRFALFLAARDDHPIDVDKIRAMCQRELPGYKVPVHFEVLDRFPLTSGYKVDRAALARLDPPIRRPAA
jgi:acyl-CoA synthetase (AMP-forming)/AMP-acid ligase II